MHRIGVPVEQRLARSRLPPGIAETPNHYVSIPLGIEWLAQSGRDVEPMHLGLLCAQELTLATLQAQLQAAILAAPTGLTRLRALAGIDYKESNGLRASLRQEGADVRVIMDMPSLDRHSYVCFTEWVNLQLCVAVLRSLAGDSWCPRELTFVSRSAPPHAVSEAFPNTRILVGQPHTTLLVGRADLARAAVAPEVTAREASEWLQSEAEHISQTEEWMLPSILSQIIQPYLNGGRTDLGFAAEILGMSKRTLQRRLQQNGLSYSEILQEARFQFAHSLLRDPNVTITDVAMASGYGSPQHFTRAFRGFTGVTPTVYRQDLIGQNIEFPPVRP
jgi:AraC-like DNA-binding protein